MQVGTIKPTATIVAQFAAGVEIEVISHEGKVFMPVMAMGDFTPKDVAPTPAKKSEPTPTPAPKETKAEKEVEAEEETSEDVHTEEELMEMSVKDLTKLCKEMGIDPSDHEGKNTNKKLRLLILEAQDGEGEDEEEEEETPAEKPSKGEAKKAPKEEEEEETSSDDLADSVASILEDFDAGKKNKKKSISAIVALGEDADEDAITKLVDSFEDDEDADIDDVANEIASVLKGEVKEDKSKKSKKAGKKSKEELVEADDLKVGDRVSVYWDDEEGDVTGWYDGEVSSIKKGKVTIAYDDDTEDVLDSDIHTKIKKLS